MSLNMVKQNDINLSVVCPWNMITCPIMEELPPDQRVLSVCKCNCDVDIEEVFAR